MFLRATNNKVNIFSETRIIVKAKQWLFHEDYSQKNLLINDIAIIQLPINVPYDVNVKPAYMYPYDPTDSGIFRDKFQDKTAKKAGWGLIGFKKKSSDDLLYTEVSVMSQADCVTEYPGISVNQICTRSPPTANIVQVTKKNLAHTHQ